MIGNNLKTGESYVVLSAASFDSAFLIFLSQYTQ